MSEQLGNTESLCPVCLRRIPASRIGENGKVYLEKTCPEHGRYRTLIWGQNARHYLDWARGSEKGSGALRSFTTASRGCPYDCGLCPDHSVGACLMVMEVTSKCNISCPVCFASANQSHGDEPAIGVIRGMYQAVLDGVGVCTIQLSGGEPTVRGDLPQVIALGKEMGFNHIMVNTNGVRIAREPDYLERLKEAGLAAIYLQFDGVSDDVYRYIRGRDLFDIKKQAVENCARQKIAVILVPTIVRGVNDHQMGGIVAFARERIPAVRGVHFQPVSYIGRYPVRPGDDDRVTIPDVIRGLESQTGGELREVDFIPRHAEDAHCSFSSIYVLTREGKLQAMSNVSRGRVAAPDTSPEESSRRFMKYHWRTDESCCSPGGPDDFLSRVLNYYLTISCMPFQDVWSLDLDRLRACCSHVVVSDRRIMPFCAYYLTSATGERLYAAPGKDGSAPGS